MDPNLIKNIIALWSTSDNITEIARELTLKVRDIPYGVIGSRLPEDVYIKNMGTCSGKHNLLRSLLEYLGVEVQEWMADHRYADLKVDLPLELRQVAQQIQQPTPHNFLKIKIADKWIVVDINWDLPLKKVGFEVNDDWDGKSDMRSTVVVLKEYLAFDAIQEKEAKLNLLSAEDKITRQLFLNKLSSWLQEVRKI